MTAPALRCLAPAKINLGLFVGPTRADGRHELASVMQSISLTDELTLEHAQPLTRAGAAGRARAPGGPAADEVLCPGIPDLAPGDNLAARALAAFRARTGWDCGPLRLTIQKRVPIAAGMGGGSGDAAATLRLAARAAGIEDGELLHALACELGADVPAQVQPGRWLALGAGEDIHRLPAPAEPFGVLVLPVPAALSTAAVYAQLDRLGEARTAEDLRELAARLDEALGDGQPLPPPELLVNDLRRAAVALCPEIAATLERAEAADADLAMLSGSGPTVLGLFAGRDGPARARRAAERLSDRHPRAAAAIPVGTGFAEPRPVRNNESADPRLGADPEA